MTSKGRLEQVRDHRGEPVVVAELDLVDADRVVLVDDRDGVPLEERRERVPHVQVAGPAVEVLVGQQELGGVPAVPAEALVVGADQVRLADRGGGLELAEVVGPARRPSWPIPAPTAPELTRATLRPVSMTALICSARWSIRAGSSVPSGPVRTLVPTLTTQVRADRTTSSRTRSRQPSPIAVLLGNVTDRLVTSAVEALHSQPRRQIDTRQPGRETARRLAQ